MSLYSAVSIPLDLSKLVHINPVADHSNTNSTYLENHSVTLQLLREQCSLMYMSTTAYTSLYS